MSSVDGRLLILDANVLIDYCAADRWVLTLISQHVGRINVPAALLDEVEDLDESECDRLSIKVVELSLDLLVNAGKRRPGLSYYDHLCLLAAKESGWTCVTNDGLWFAKKPSAPQVFRRSRRRGAGLAMPARHHASSRDARVVPEPHCCAMIRPPHPGRPRP